MHSKLAGHDLVLAIGTGAFRAYLFDEPVPLVEPGTRVGVITDDPDEAHRSPCEVALVASVGDACTALASLLPDRPPATFAPLRRPPAPEPPAADARLEPGPVLAALAERLPANAVVIEETPSSRPELLDRIPARSPLGFVSNANGGLGFGFAGAIGLRMGLTNRPVVGVIGDGSAMYAIQSLWSAARYGSGVLLIVLSNGRYAIMDALAQERGGVGPWPGFEGIDIAGIAACLGCPAVRVERHAELLETLDEVIPGLGDRREPLLIEVVVD
jgi:benzoylformate decarboxylase